MLRNNGGSKPLQRFPVGNISDKPVSRLSVDDPDGGAFAQEGIRGSPADSVSAACDDDGFVLKSFHSAFSFAGFGLSDFQSFPEDFGFTVFFHKY